MSRDSDDRDDAPEQHPWVAKGLLDGGPPRRPGVDDDEWNEISEDLERLLSGDEPSRDGRAPAMSAEERAELEGMLARYEADLAAPDDDEDGEALDPEELERMALAVIEAELGPPDGELHAALAAGVNRVERVVNELREKYEWMEDPFKFTLWADRGLPGFQFSPAAAPLLGLGVALDAMLRELRGDPQGCHLDWQANRAFEAAREQMQRLIDMGYLTPAAFAPRMALEGARFDGPRGREAIAHWWRVSGLAVRVYRDAYDAMAAAVASEDRERLDAKKALVASELDAKLLLEEERLVIPVAASADQWFSGVYLRLLGMQYGFSLVHGGASPRQVELGVRHLLRLFTAGQVPPGLGEN